MLAERLESRVRTDRSLKLHPGREKRDSYSAAFKTERTRAARVKDPMFSLLWLFPDCTSLVCCF